MTHSRSGRVVLSIFFRVASKLLRFSDPEMAFGVGGEKRLLIQPAAADSDIVLRVPVKGSAPCYS